jgi:hypothetical protein
MLGNGARAKILRAYERLLLQRTPLVIVSSPAFVQNYFGPLQARSAGVLLVENKMLLEPGAPAPASLPAAPPWRIGWFGVLRCRRSLEMLAKLARDNPGLIEVDLRGRPASHELKNFDQTVRSTPGLFFHGPYEASDLSRIYSKVHFAWAVDYFDAGGNSDWLLPNRLYESLAFGVPVMARADTEVGAWLRAQALADPCDAVNSFSAFFQGLNWETYEELSSRARRIQRQDIVFEASEVHDILNKALGVGPRISFPEEDGEAGQQRESHTSQSVGGLAR